MTHGHIASPGAAASAREPSTGWCVLEPARVLADLRSSEDRGLSPEEASARLATYGPNVLVESARRGTLRMVIAQFSDVMVLVLLGAAVIAGLLGEWEDIVAILAVVMLNAVLGFVQELRAERAVAALRALSAPLARVRRNAVDNLIPAATLVPGDVVLLEAGNVVPADLRLVSVRRLRVEEAALTGESEPTEKTADAIADVVLALGDRRNMAYKGTVVSYGRATGVVVATGMRTELGRIASLMQDVEVARTPLQLRLAHVGRNLAIAAMALCAVIFAAGLLRGEAPGLMFMTALSLAVAAIPEALPAVVTVALALGARKMAREHALVRRLPAVETLGSVTFICSDKTGTLTENRMRVEVMQPSQRLSVMPSIGASNGTRSLFLEAIALSNDATRHPDGEPSGDPTETALYRAAEDAGFAKEVLESRWPRVAEIAFSSERSRMTTVHRDGGGFIAFTKGAPEIVLAGCIDRLGARAIEPIDRKAALADAERLAASGLRVLAVAMRRLPALPGDLEKTESSQTFLGLIGLLDPPREAARDAVALCRSAGIHVVMITGDHPATARAIAERVGIAGAGDVIVTGAELASMSAVQLEARVRDIRVYARVAAEEKLRIVQALQRRGECVAMTGDGVNDAPALRRADIGIAMGRIGTDVARESADMVLLDDDFATIVKAVREGRRIYDNVRRFVRYSLATNSGEIWTLFLAPFVGLPLPLLPIHILWMNLVTDGLPGLALAAERPERDVMRRPPRRPAESILANGLWQHAMWVGLLMAALALGTQSWALRAGHASWQSMTFTVLTFSQLAHGVAIRSEHDSSFRLGLLSNRPLLGAVLLTIALQMAALYVPALRLFFRTAPLTIGELFACVGISSIVFLAVEGEKWFYRHRSIHRSASGVAA